MDTNILTILVSGVCTLLGSIIGALMSIQIIKYRLQQLEKKVEKHNSVVERQYITEQKCAVICEAVANLKEDVAALKAS